MKYKIAYSSPRAALTCDLGSRGRSRVTLSRDEAGCGVAIGWVGCAPQVCARDARAPRRGHGRAGPAARQMSTRELGPRTSRALFFCAITDLSYNLWGSSLQLFLPGFYSFIEPGFGSIVSLLFSPAAWIFPRPGCMRKESRPSSPHCTTAHQRPRTASASNSSSPLLSSAGTIPAQSSSVGAYSSGARTLFAPLACSASSQACTRRTSSGASTSRGSASSSAWCQGCAT